MLVGHVAGAFADQVGAVVLGLIAAVLEDDEQHGDAHEDAEDHHRGGNREVGLDEQGVDAEHHENGGVLIEVLHGDGACFFLLYILRFDGFDVNGLT